MKTLKKTLCLVLAVVMVVGVLVIPANADYDDYKDVADVKHAVAIEVLTGLGIIDGTSDSTFSPNSGLTRAQGATLVARALLTRDVADDLPAAESFNDVTASFRWASGAIAFGVQNDIIAGVGGNKFNPGGSLTGYQLAKMLLVALGNDGDKYLGNGYEMKVYLDAQDAKLLGGLKDFDGSKPIDRDDAAQMLFNAINSGDKEVTATKTAYQIVSMKSDYATAAGQSKLDLTTTYDTFQDALNAATANYASSSGEDLSTKAYGNDFTIVDVLVDASYTEGSLAHDKFELSTSKTAVTDTFGRPVTTYTSHGKPIATVEDEAVISSTEPISAAELYTTLGADAVISQTVVNEPGSTTTTGSLAAAAGFNTAIGNNKVALGGYGIVTEIYDISTANAPDRYKVVQIVPAVVQIAGIAHTNATSTHGANDVYTFTGNGAVASGTFTNYTNTVSSSDVSNVVLNGTVAKDDWVVVYGAGVVNNTTNNPLVITPAKTMTGTLTKYESSTSTYTVGGSTYHGSAAKGATDPAASNYGKELTYVLDDCGNVANTVAVITSNSYVFVLEYAKSSYLDGNKVKDVVEATVITAEGTLDTIQVASFATSRTDTSPTAANPSNVGQYNDKTNGKLGAYIYDVNSDGSYKLISPGSKVTTSNFAANGYKGTSALVSGKYANNSTKFYIATQSGTTFTGVNVYANYKDVTLPNLSSGTHFYGIVDDNEDGIAEYVFLSPVATSTNVNYVYVKAGYSYDGSKYTYETIVDGEADTLTLSAPITTISLPALVSIENGVAKVVNDATLSTSTPTDGVYSGKFFTWKEGLLFQGDNTNTQNTYLADVAASVPVYTYKDGEVTVGKASDLSAATGEKIVLVVAGGAVSKIYIDTGAAVKSGDVSMTAAKASSSAVSDNTGLGTGLTDGDIKSVTAVIEGGTLKINVQVDEAKNLKADALVKLTITMTHEGATFKGDGSAAKSGDITFKQTNSSTGALEWAFNSASEIVITAEDGTVHTFAIDKVEITMNNVTAAQS